MLIGGKEMLYRLAFDIVVLLSCINMITTGLEFAKKSEIRKKKNLPIIDLLHSIDHAATVAISSIGAIIGLFSSMISITDIIIFKEVNETTLIGYALSLTFIVYSSIMDKHHMLNEETPGHIYYIAKHHGEDK